MDPSFARSKVEMTHFRYSSYNQISNLWVVPITCLIYKASKRRELKAMAFQQFDARCATHFAVAMSIFSYYLTR